MELQVILLGDRALSQYDSFIGEIVFKRPFINDIGKASAHLFISGRQSFDPFSQEAELLGWHDSFCGKMVLKRLFPGDTGEVSALYIHCSGLWVDRDLSQYSSFSDSMVLKRLCISDTGEKHLHIHCSCDLGDSRSSGGQNASQYHRLRRWSSKGSSSVTWGKHLYYTFSLVYQETKASARRLSCMSQ